MKNFLGKVLSLLITAAVSVMLFCGCDREKKQNEELAKTLEKICVGGGMPGAKVLSVTNTGGKKWDQLHYKAKVSYKDNTAEIDFYTEKIGDNIEVRTAYPQLLHLIGKTCSQAAGREMQCILVDNVTAVAKTTGGGIRYTGKATVVDKDTRHILNVEYKEDKLSVEVKVTDAIKLVPGSTNSIFY